MKTTQTPAAAENDSRSRSGFSQFYDSGSRSERKTQDPPGVDSAFQICNHLWCRPFWYTKKLGYWFHLINNSSKCVCFGNCFLSLARTISCVRFDSCFQPGFSLTRNPFFFNYQTRIFLKTWNCCCIKLLVILITPKLQISACNGQISTFELSTIIMRH